MHITMYTEGDSITVKGVKCDFVRCKLSEQPDYEKKGYTCDVMDLSNDVGETPDIPELTNDEIRALAQDAEIEGYQTKRIETLKKELDI